MSEVKEHSTTVVSEQSSKMSDLEENPSESAVQEKSMMLEAKEHLMKSEVGGNSVVPEVKQLTTMSEEEDTRHDHLDTFEDFFGDLNQAASSALPSVPRKYSSVHVLLIRWQDDDLGVESKINDLDEVLTTVYHYSTERYLIPSERSSAELEFKLVHFRQAYDTETSLLIVYYGGHGRLDRTKDPPRSIWQPRKRSKVNLTWSDLQGAMERAVGDVVLFLDCCFAATASRGSGSKEGLWACGSLSTTAGVNDSSFTQNLIAELKLLSSSRFNIAMLHQNLMKRWRKPETHMLLTEPWYSYLSSIISPSVELAPLPEAQDERVDAAPEIKAKRSEPLVLLAIRLKTFDTVPGSSSWQSWLHKNAPNSVNSVLTHGSFEARASINLEGHFRSDPDLVLVSLPTFLWEGLPSRAAYSFVSFVRSSNFLLSKPRPQFDDLIRSQQVRQGEDEAKARTVKISSETEQSGFSDYPQGIQEIPR